MRVFITGATGYIGMNVALALRRAGHEVWGMVRSAEKGIKFSRHEIHPVVGSLDDPTSYLPIAERSNILVTAAEDHSNAATLDKLTIESLLSVGNKGPQPKTFIYTSGTWIYGESGPTVVDESSPVDPVRLKPWRPSHEMMVLNAPKRSRHCRAPRMCLWTSRGHDRALVRRTIQGTVPARRRHRAEPLGDDSCR